MRIIHKININNVQLLILLSHVKETFTVTQNLRLMIILYLKSKHNYF